MLRRYAVAPFALAPLAARSRRCKADVPASSEAHATETTDAVAAKDIKDGTDAVVEAAGAEVVAPERKSSILDAARKAPSAPAVQAPPKKEEKAKRKFGFKVKHKAPWGDHQLRDSWSIDAMARFDSDSFGKRLDREYRYHPEAHLRRYIRWMALGFFPISGIAILVLYYAIHGDWMWNIGDFQNILNALRSHDTSPRSTLYAHRSQDEEVELSKVKQHEAYTNILRRQQEPRAAATHE